MNYRLLLVVVCAALLHFSAFAAEEAGTVALVSGQVLVKHGEIIMPANVAKSTPKVRYHDNFEKELAPNDTIYAGDIIETKGDAFVKIYYRDDSIMDIGPNTTFKVSQFQQSGKMRNISFQMLYGKVRTLVTRALIGSSSYNVSTPISNMGVRGTEFVVHSYMQKSQYKTDITCLEGKVAVNVQKMGPGGKIITQPVLVTPGHSFSGTGGLGPMMKFNVSKLSGPQLDRMVAIVPNITVKGGGAASTPEARSLAGGTKVGIASEAANRRPSSVEPVADVVSAKESREESAREKELRQEGPERMAHSMVAGSHGSIGHFKAPDINGAQPKGLNAAFVEKRAIQQRFNTLQPHVPVCHPVTTGTGANMVTTTVCN